MNVTLNGKPVTLAEDAVVADAVGVATSPEQAEIGAGLAVAMDGVIVPHGEWASTSVAAGSSIEVLTAYVGG